jgi:hypothetical protein
MVPKRGKGALLGLVICGTGVLFSGCHGGGSTSGSGGSPGNSATLNWTAPTTQADGSTPLAELSGYRVHYGTASRRYTVDVDVGNVTTCVVSNLVSGTYYFAVTAYNSGGESDYSVEGSKTIP